MHTSAQLSRRSPLFLAVTSGGCYFYRYPEHIRSGGLLTQEICIPRYQAAALRQGGLGLFSNSELLHYGPDAHRVGGVRILTSGLEVLPWPGACRQIFCKLSAQNAAARGKM